MAKKRKDDELDTETTFADMNIDGFKWYDPSLKQAKAPKKQNVSRKEYRALVLGMFRALLPVILILAVAFLLVYSIARLWLA